jgi:hypothetical protein
MIIKTWDIFEGYLDEPEYKEISRHDYLNICFHQDSKVTIDISKSVINRIKEKISPDTKVLLSKIFPFLKLNYVSKEISICLINNKANWKVFIIELEDEWFLVIDGTNDFFKCDGIPGLLKCLKDRNIIK